MENVKKIYDGQFLMYPQIDPMENDSDMVLLGMQKPQAGERVHKNSKVKVNKQGELFAETYYALSDERLKNITSELNINVEDLAKLPLFNFTWKSDDDQKKEQSGTSAQAVKALLPNIVSGEQILTLNYGTLGVIAGIVAAREISELKKEIADLKAKLNV